RKAGRACKKLTEPRLQRYVLTMLRHSILTPLLVVFAGACAHATPPAPAPAPPARPAVAQPAQPASVSTPSNLTGEAWVQAALQRLNLREKIGQLFMVWLPGDYL